MCSGSEAGSYLRLIDSCITQRQDQGPSRRRHGHFLLSYDLVAGATWTRSERGEGPAANIQWFRGGLVVKAHRLCVSLNSRLESNKEEEDTDERVRRECRAKSTSYCPGAMEPFGTSTHFCIVNSTTKKCQNIVWDRFGVGANLDEEGEGRGARC